MDTEEGEFIIEGNPGSPEDERFDSVVGTIEDFMIEFDLVGALNTLPSFSSVTDDHEKHTIFRNFLANVEVEMDGYVLSRCQGFANLEEVGQLLESRKEEITDEVWEFVSDGCLDYLTFVEQWEKVNP